MLIGFTGNYMIDFVAREFKKIMPCDLYISDFCQYQQEIIFDGSSLQNKNCDFIVLMLDGEILLKSIGIEKWKQHLDSLIASFLQNQTSKYLLISNIYLPRSVDSILNFNSNNDTKSIQEDINKYLRDIAIKNDNIYIVDILTLIEEYGAKNLFDNGLWYLGRNRYTKFGNKLIANQINYTINAVVNNTKKCLVLDLDNTLWGGVVGEDGLQGIKIAQDGIGEVYRNFQIEIKKIKEKGILLALCSKNNLNDAKEVFDIHRDMVLKWDDFIIHKVNWELKSENIKDIAKELNIGEDSLVFIDDNPTEREIVSKETNCIVTDFPEREEELLSLIAMVDLKYFSKMAITNEDKTKYEQYKQNLERLNEEKSFVNIDDFIRNLNITLTIYKDSVEQITRIAQLTQKTNQFNLTTKRYTEEDIKLFMNNDNFSVFSADVKDKYGNYGIVLVAILEYSNKKVNIDTFLMSCRVIGKKIENVFLYNILKEFNSESFEGKYIRTAKNVLVEDFYDTNYFDCTENTEKVKCYKLTILNDFNNNLMEVKNGSAN